MPVVPFTPRSGRVVDAMLEVGEVEHEVLHPERRALADGRELRGLEVRVAQRRLGAPLPRERGQRAHHRRRASPRSSAKPSRIRIRSRVVGDVGARRAEVDDRRAPPAPRRRRRGRAPSRRGGSCCSYSSAAAKSMSSRCARICAIPSSGHRCRARRARPAPAPPPPAPARAGARVRGASAATRARASPSRRSAPRSGEL